MIKIGIIAHLEGIEEEMLQKTLESEIDEVHSKETDFACNGAM